MPMQQRAIATRERIVAAAAQIFAASSYAEAAMSDITRAAEVTQGSVYFHFNSKSDLAREIVDRQHALSMHIGEKCMSEDKPALDTLVALSHDLATSMVENPIMRAGLRLSTESYHSLPESPKAPYDNWMEMSTDLLRTAVQNGELPKNTDIETTANLLIGSFIGQHVLASALGDLDNIHQRLDFLWDTLLPSIKGKR